MRNSPYAQAIAASGFSIYDPITVGDPTLWIPSEDLEQILDSALRGLSLKGLAIRTRSKVVKAAICKALGYPVPKSFSKCKPRFPGQDFDTYTQKGNNLQVWNEEVSPTRRYVLVRTADADIVTKVRVVNGAELAKLDTTGKLTTKYQARLNVGTASQELIVATDTSNLIPALDRLPAAKFSARPTDNPEFGKVIPIALALERLATLIGFTFKDSGSDQERNRGAALHRNVCAALGYATYGDDGQFPDVLHQLIEVKLQTSPTIDLGVVEPNSIQPLGIPIIGGIQVRHCDVRYALFYAKTDGQVVTVTHLYLTTGQAFFSRFAQFGGKVINSKIQIPLPSGFFA